MSNCAEDDVMANNEKFYPFNLTSAFLSGDLVDVDRRLREDSHRLFRNDQLRVGLQIFSRDELATHSEKKAIDEKGPFSQYEDYEMIDDSAAFRIELEV